MFLNFIFDKLTNTDALKLASGKFEIYFFEFMYRVIYFFGISISDRSIKYGIYSIVVKTLLVLLACAEVWNFCTMTWSIEGITDGINVILIQICALCKYTVLITNKDVFKDLASAMESKNFDLSTKKRKKIVKIWRRRNESWLKVLLAIGTCTVIAWHIYPLMDDMEYNLMVSIRLPFDYKTPSLYPITYICTLIVFSYMCYFVMTNDLIVQAHLMHILCQFAVLNDSFENILSECCSDFQDPNMNNLYLNENFVRIYKKRLGGMVEQHKLILSNTLKLRDLISTPMLIHLATSTTLICSISYQLTTVLIFCFAVFSVDVNVTKGLMSLFYLGYNMFVLYIICRWCEEIKIQSEKIGEAVYFSGWENGIVKIPGVKNAILLILARANNPSGLSAGGMYDLSLEAYANMVKTSYSALTVLLRLR